MEGLEVSVSVPDAALFALPSGRDGFDMSGPFCFGRNERTVFTGGILLRRGF